MTGLILFFLVGIAAGLVPETRTMRQKIEFWNSLMSSKQKVKIRYYEHSGIGFEVTEPISHGEVIFQVSASQALYGLLPFSLSPYIKGLPPRARLKVRLLYEKFMGKPGEFFTEYVNCLPTSFSAPTLWDREDLQYLSDLDIIYLADLVLDITEEYQKVVRALQKAKNIPGEMLKYESYVWAHLAVETRGMGLNREDLIEMMGISEQLVPEENDCMIVPLLDLVNHYPKIEQVQGGFAKNHKNKLVQIVADRNFRPGQEFVYEYGPDLPNLNLFRFFGFSIHRNALDYFFLKTKTDSCYGDLDDEGACSYKFDVKKMNMKFLKFIRSSINDPTVPDIEDPVQYYHSIQPTSIETKQNFIVALRYYRKFVRDILFKKKNLRALKDGLGKVQGHRKIGLEFLVAAMSSRYHHLTLSDRAFLKCLTSFD